jgi:hypothetical protein
MTTQDLDAIIQAIKERKSISFEYNKPDKVEGIRLGNPYVIWNNDDETKKYLDLHQQSGVSDSVSQNKAEFPHWVTLETDYISNVTITTDTFIPIESYKRYSKRFMIANIQI